jgi:hypothetical protein
MKQLKLRWAFALLLASGFTIQVRAASITNNFNSNLNYLANGVPGTMWDGVYLGFGDIFNGNDAGDVGTTVEADETLAPGFLTVVDTMTDWAGSGDDGFFLWKVVAGDFDASVYNAAPFQNPNYHFGGLMARAYSAGPHWGAPYNGSENWQDIMRFQEFSIDEDIRYATNGVDNDGYIDVTGADADTATGRYFRITRTGDVFTFYNKTNQSDPWTLQGTLNRPDLHDVPMQVGIADCTFGTAQPTTFFTDFELTGTNVAASVTSPANPTGLTATTNVASVTFSWTPGAGSDGSILVLRKNNPVILTQKPVNGYTYNANTNFARGDDIGGGIYVVYAGSGSTATIAGLGSTNQSYSVALYSYSGSGSSIVYGTTPATNSIIGTGIPQGINFTIANGVPINGVGVPTLVAFDNIGDTDVVAAATATWSSSDGTIAPVGADGTVSGLAAGTAQIAVTLNGFNATNSVTVRSPVFTDNFTTAHDYLKNALPGSAWDGIYLRGSDIPNATFAPPAATVTAFNANISSNSALVISAANSQWKNAEDNGPFLFKVVPGDFQAVVHITNYSIINYDFVGLMARAFNTANGASGSGPRNAENCLQWMRFDEFGDSTVSFNTLNGNTAETDDRDGDVTDFWLLMTRVNATNFYVFKKANLTDPWQSVPNDTAVRPDWTNGVPLQVGLMQAMFSGANGTVAFDNFMLDAPNISGGTPPSAASGLVITENPAQTQATLTWVAGTNSDGSQATSFVVMKAGSPVSAQPYFGILTSPNSVFGTGTDLGGGNFVVFRGVGNTVTVTGLKPGTIYYATVYMHSGSGTTKSFNEVGSTSASTPPVVFTGISATLPGGSLPAGGVGFPVVIGAIQGGGTLDVTPSVQVASGNSNILVGANGILTGLSPGTVTNTFIFVSGTNVLTAPLVATVRPAKFTDNFSTPHDYIANGITNTTWDGVYAQPGSIPGTVYVSDPAASIVAADADTTSNGVLNVVSENVGWENGQNDGFFLFKNVRGDFQSSVHITYLNSAGIYDGADMTNFNNPGLLARLYTTNGSPFNTTNGAEAWISFTRFDLFGIGTYARRTLSGLAGTGTTQRPNGGTGFNGANTTSDTNLWLLVVRQDLTNFMFFQRMNATDPWKQNPALTTFTPAVFTNLNLQVGLLAGGFNSGNQVQDGFDSFMLDQPLHGPTLSTSASGGNVNVFWPPSGSFTLQYSPSLSSPNWQSVSIAPVYSGGTSLGAPVVHVSGMNTVTVPITNSTSFFRLVQ